MQEIPWSIVIHLGLFLVSAAYAAFLQRIYKLYHPDHTWVTVVGGVVLVGGAFALECYVWSIPPIAVLLFATLFAASGIPIIRWQRQQQAERERVRADLERGDATTTVQTLR
jgi:hypothetical protein